MLSYPSTPPIAAPDTGGNLPAPPPSATAKKASIWDKEHISETLANIGQAFLSNQNFSDGLGAAAGAIGTGMRGLREQQRKSTEYGGPDDMFEITTHPTTGERSIREVPEFSKAVQAKRDAMYGLKGKDATTFRSNALYGIGQLPTEQRQAAYEELLRNPSLYGVDPEGLPPVWSDTLGALAGGVTMSQKDWLKAGQTKRTNDARISQGEERNRISRSRLAGKAPPGVRKPGGYYSPRSRAEYDALPSGAKIKAPDGTLRIKP